MMQIEGTYRKTGIKDPTGVDVLDGSLLRYRHPSAKYRKSNKVFHVKLDQRLIDLIGGNPDKVTKYLAENCLHVYGHVSTTKTQLIVHEFSRILDMMNRGTYRTGKAPRFEKVSDLNLETQYYKGVPLQQIARKDYHALKARRFTLNGTNQNVWIPNAYLLEDGTFKAGINIDFVFRGSRTRFERAGILNLYKQFSRPNN